MNIHCCFFNHLANTHFCQFDRISFITPKSIIKYPNKIQQKQKECIKVQNQVHTQGYSWHFSFYENSVSNKIFNYRFNNRKNYRKDKIMACKIRML